VKVESKPKWLRRRLPSVGKNEEVQSLVTEHLLHTVCVEAQCPNQMECYGRGEATFLLLGPSCTRRCTFCSVSKSRMLPLDAREPARVADAVAQLGLSFAVLTMVTRDDITDGGAEHVRRTVAAVREKSSEVGVELLISDLGGDWHGLDKILAVRPEVLSHNVETVPRLYSEVRPQADYRRSLALLGRAAAYRPTVVTKSGLMLGLGEARDEVLKTMDDLRNVGCHLLTLGQYLAPSRRHHPVIRYLPPDEFAGYEADAYARGFKGVASGPLVRSSYRAGRLFHSARSAIAR
jgi:lipoic acid synthetase